MLAQRARWLPHLVGRRFEELSEELSQGIAKVLRQLQAQLEQAFESGARRQIVELARHAKTTLDAAGGDADLRRQLQAIADAEEGVANDALVPDIECWRAIAHLVLTKKDQSGAIQFRRRVDIRQGFGPKDPKKKMFEQWLTDWSSPERATLLDEARQAPPVCFDADERELMQALVRLLLLAASQLELAFRERGEVDFIGVAAAAREVLREVGDLDRERILHQGSRLQHLLIDEIGRAHV